MTKHISPLSKHCTIHLNDILSMKLKVFGPYFDKEAKSL